MFIDAATTSLTVRDRPPASVDHSRKFSRYAVANVGDAMDRLNVMDSSIKTQWIGGRCVGPALTVLTRDGDNLAIHRALDEAQPGDILVINALGGTARAVFGDLLAEVCVAAGVAGVVIDGLTRDRTAIEELQLPLWARGVSPAGPAKYGPGQIFTSIACGGVVVSPGDIIVGDDDGVAVVPHEKVASVAERLAAIDQFEEAFRRKVRNTSLPAR